MTEEEKQKLNEGLAKWIGHWVQKDEGGYKYNRLHLDSIDECVIVRRQESNGEWLEWATTFLPQFTDSLDACFKWLVPKLGYFCLTTEDKGGFYADVSIGEEYAEYFKAETPALAFCLAIEKLIDKERQ